MISFILAGNHHWRFYRIKTRVWTTFPWYCCCSQSHPSPSTSPCSGPCSTPTRQPRTNFDLGPEAPTNAAASEGHWRRGPWPRCLHGGTQSRIRLRQRSRILYHFAYGSRRRHDCRVFANDNGHRLQMVLRQRTATRTPREDNLQEHTRSTSTANLRNAGQTIVLANNISRT